MEAVATNNNVDVFEAFNEFLLNLAEIMIPIAKVVGEFIQALPAVAKILVEELFSIRNPDRTFPTAVIDRVSKLSPFDKFVGPRLYESLMRTARNRLSDDAWLQIALDIDTQGWAPSKYLEGELRGTVSEWNQKNPRRAIHTFQSALNPQNKKKGPLQAIRRGAQRRIYRAKERCIRTESCPQ